MKKTRKQGRREGRKKGKKQARDGSKEREPYPPQLQSNHQPPGPKLEKMMNVKQTHNGIDQH